MTRPMTRRITLGAVITVGALSIAVSSQSLSPAAVRATEIAQVRDNLYVITGSDATNREAFSGGNTGVFVGDAGVTVVDTKLPGWGAHLLDRIRTVTDQPVVRIINTHTHGDHTGSNAFFPETVEIVAHANTRANMERMDAFAGDNAAFLPTRTYGDRLTLGTGRDRLELYHFGAGHTDGDTVIVYPALRVLQMGDMFPWKDAPFLDRSNGGSGVAMPDTLSKLLATIDNVDTVVPGHIPVTTPAALEEFQRFTADLLAATRRAIADGQSADEAAASIDLSGRYPDYAANRVPAAIQAIYEELGR